MAGYIGSKAVNLSTTGADINGDANIDGDLSFRDNDKIKLGAGSDLQIYHDGTHSRITDSGTGNLRVRATDFRLEGNTGSDLLSTVDGAGVTLYYANAAKLATTSTGVDITGVLSSDALNVSAASPNIDVTDTGTSHASQDFLTNSNAVRATIGVERSSGGGLFVGSSPYAAVFGTASAGNTEFATNNNVRMTISASGNVGIGTSSPSSPLQIQSSNNQIRLVDSQNTSMYCVIETISDAGLLFNADVAGAAASSRIQFNVDNSEKMRIDNDGNVGIGTTSPYTLLELSSIDPILRFNDSNGGTDTKNFELRYVGTSSPDIDGLYFRTVNDANNVYSDKMVILGSGNVGIGTSSPSQKLEVSDTAVQNVVLRITNNDGNAEMQKYQDDLYLNLNDTGNIIVRSGSPITERMRITSDGSVGIGTTSPAQLLHLASSAPDLRIEDTDGGYADINVAAGSIELRSDQGNTQANSTLKMFVDGSERMRLDASGNLLVGKTSTNSDNAGFEANSTGFTAATRSNGTVFVMDRLVSDGEIVSFRKDNSTVGSIGNTGANIYLAGANSGFKFYSSGFHATNTSGVAVDNSENIGASNVRWNDAYITNGVTTGSDGNDKQDIRDLTEAEQRVAVACKGLLKAWRWKSAVEEKGDDARIHCGIIAQDLQAEFAAEGLDASRYGMFMSNTWWEAQTEVPAVEAVAEVLDEEGNVVTEAVEAVDAYTRTDTYDTQEEAPEGATERTRLGVRYSELLAFIIGAL